MSRRNSTFEQRRKAQREALRLPRFPSTTIGSFPQTAEVRRARAGHARGTLSDADYREYLRAQTAKIVKWQDEAGLDVLVHGEFERNDMVQYFGEQTVGLRVQQTRMGAKLWIPLRAAADDLRRRLSAARDDR